MADKQDASDLTATARRIVEATAFWQASLQRRDALSGIKKARELLGDNTPAFNVFNTWAHNQRRLSIRKYRVRLLMEMFLVD